MLRPAHNPPQRDPDRWIRAKHENFTTGPLVDKIDAMYEAELIGRGLKEAAHEIRFIGNEMAHGDFVTDIDQEDSADVLGFLEELAKASPLGRGALPEEIAEWVLMAGGPRNTYMTGEQIIVSGGYIYA